MLVQKLSLDLQKPASNKLTLGTSFASFTDREHDFNNKFGNIVESVENIKNSTVRGPERRLRAMVALTRDPGSFPSIHTDAGSHLSIVPVPGDLTPC